jgi:hypothetical protein
MDIILTGFLGEFGGSHTWPRLLMARSRQAAIDAIYGRFVAAKLAMVQRIFQPAFYSRVFPAVREMFFKSFEQVENEHPFDIADSWNFMHLQCRGTFQSPAVDRHQFEMRAPHTDTELVDFLLTIPPYARLEQRVYKRMIASSFPGIRDVPCTNSARPIEPDFVKEYAAMVGSYAARRISAPIRNLIARQPSLGREFRDLSQDFRAEPEVVNGILRPLLQSGIFPGTIFNAGAIEQIIREHYEQQASHEHALALLTSWGLAVKYFLHDDLTGAPEDMYAEAQM